MARARNTLAGRAHARYSALVRAVPRTKLCSERLMCVIYKLYALSETNGASRVGTFFVALSLADKQRLIISRK